MKRFLFALFFLGMLVGVTPSAKAAATCDCWCTSNVGAYKISGKGSQTECATWCKKEGHEMAACALTANQTPERNPYCFTEEQCSNQNGVLQTTNIGPVNKVLQAPECLTGQTYCYPDPEKAAKTQLNVAIGDYKVSGDFSEYVNVWVNWLLGAGITVVIVMIMVGGFQYTLGAASPGQIGEGKKKIVRAVTGLLLLVSAYLILMTVNPYLVRMQMPKYPMVKRMDLVTPTSCEEMEKEYVVTAMDGSAVPAAQKKCGVSGKIEKKKDGTSVNPITCDYQVCAGAGEMCLGTGELAKCLTCQQVTYESTSPAPSSQVCQSLTLPSTSTVVGGVAVPKDVHYCFYSHDPTIVLSTAQDVGIITGLVVGAGANALSLGTLTPVTLAATGGLSAYAGKQLVGGVCASLKINCSQIKKCDDYDTVDAVSDAVSAGSDMENFWRSGAFNDFDLERLCAQNPCNVQYEDAPGTPQTQVCRYNTKAWIKNDCIRNK